MISLKEGTRKKAAFMLGRIAIADMRRTFGFIVLRCTFFQSLAILVLVTV